MAVVVNSSFGSNQNRIINVPVGRLLCSRKWMNSDLAASIKGHTVLYVELTPCMFAAIELWIDRSLLSSRFSLYAYDIPTRVARTSTITYLRFA